METDARILMQELRLDPDSPSGRVARSIAS